MNAKKEVFFMSKAAELMQEINLGEAVDVSSVIQELIDAEPSDDNEKQGKTVQLLRGLAFSDDEKSTKFMKKLTSLMSKENFGDLV